MPTRYYFHLVDSRNVIRDDLGAVATSLDDARNQAAEIVSEFARDQGYRRQEWLDWKLVVTDDSSEFALVIPLAP